MIPLSDGIPARRFPYVNVGFIVACFVGTIFSIVISVFAGVFIALLFGGKKSDGGDKPADEASPGSPEKKGPTGEAGK